MAGRVETELCTAAGTKTLNQNHRMNCHQTRNRFTATGPKNVGRLRVATFLGVLISTSVASAATYNVEHTLRLRPGGNMAPRVTATYYAHAWIQEQRNDCVASEVQPSAAAQPLGWGEFGTDRLSSLRGQIRNTGNGGGATEANPEIVQVGAGGLAKTFTATARGCLSRAVANATFAINPLVAGGPVTGTIRAHGEATAALRPPRKSAAYAFSMAMVEAQGGRLLRNGKIEWRKIVRDVVSGKASDRRQVDPIDFTVRDLVTGVVTTGTLYSVIIEATNRAAGGFQWESNVVRIDVQDLNFSVGFPSTNTSLQGMASLTIRNGAVTASSATGIYAGLLPAPGAIVPLSFNLPDQVDFDYDLGNFDGHDLEVALNFDGAGEAFDAKETEDVPTLTITGADPAVPSAGVLVSWPVTSQPTMLESTMDLRTWAPLPVETRVADGRVWARVPALESGWQYFRLRLLEPTDTTPPSFEVYAECGSPKVFITYSEPVDFETALNPQNYRILSSVPGSVRVANVVPQDAQRICLFLDQPIRPGAPYVLQVQNVTDLAGNRVPEGRSATIGCSAQ